MSESRMRTSEIAEDYRREATRNSVGMHEGKHRMANRAYDKLKKIFLFLQKDPALAEVVLVPLLRDEDVGVQIIAAADCLRLGIHVQDAESVLVLASEREDIGITRLNAEMTLRVWRQQGYLKS